jgi:hypothetical protein
MMEVAMVSEMMGFYLQLTRLVAPEEFIKRQDYSSIIAADA